MMVALHVSAVSHMKDPTRPGPASSKICLYHQSNMRKGNRRKERSFSQPASNALPHPGTAYTLLVLCMAVAGCALIVAAFNIPKSLSSRKVRVCVRWSVATVYAQLRNWYPPICDKWIEVMHATDIAPVYACVTAPIGCSGALGGTGKTGESAQSPALRPPTSLTLTIVAANMMLVGSGVLPAAASSRVSSASSRRRSR